MTKESALQIFIEQHFSDPQKAVDTMTKINTLDELTQEMRAGNTGLSADQFVNFRLASLFKGDSAFQQTTVEQALEKFKQPGIPEEIIKYYISNGGGIDVAIVINLGLGDEFPNVQNMDDLKTFYKDANQYLFEQLKNYISQ